jgi:hypothetical protein
MTLRIAFIGTGQMAGLHLNALDRVSTAHTVVGVHDLNTAAAGAFAERAGARAYATLTALFAEARPDVAHICTPLGTHFEPARQALLAGAHVYVEKPFVETQEEAEVLFALARERGLLICAGHQLLRDPAFCSMLQQARAAAGGSRRQSLRVSRPGAAPGSRGTACPRSPVAGRAPHRSTPCSSRWTACPADAAVEIAHVTATPTETHAVLHQGRSQVVCV